MKKGLAFEGIKYFGAGEVQHYEGPADEVDSGELEMFSPIKPGDAFQIEVVEGINPSRVSRWIKFSGPESVGEFDFAEYGRTLEWIDDESDFSPKYGEITRSAVLKQGHELCHFVALPYNGDLLTLLMDSEEHYEPSIRYKSDRTVISFSHHVEGGAPISWEGSAAIHQIGDLWAYAYGGDNRPRADHLETAPTEAGQVLYEWLINNRALTVFILEVIKCEWQDEKLAEELEVAWADACEVAGASHQLTQQELSEVLKVIQKNSDEGRELIELLRAPNHPLADSLVSVLKNVWENQSASEIVDSDGFMNTLQNYK